MAVVVKTLAAVRGSRSWMKKINQVARAAERDRHVETKFQATIATSITFTDHHVVLHQVTATLLQRHASCGESDSSH